MRHVNANSLTLVELSLKRCARMFYLDLACFNVEEREHKWFVEECLQALHAMIQHVTHALLNPELRNRSVRHSQVIPLIPINATQILYNHLS
jgi:hypothetical protein